MREFPQLSKKFIHENRLNSVMTKYKLINQNQQNKSLLLRVCESEKRNKQILTIISNIFNPFSLHIFL